VGETAIDLLPLLDWDALSAAQPTWMVGFSDISTIITPLTLVTGMATIHGNNLMDTPYRPPAGLLSWLDIVPLPPGASFTQSPPGRYRDAGWDDYRHSPQVDQFTLDTAGRWRRLEGLLVYVEAAEDDAATICRNLHGMLLNGFFTAANAVLVGRTRAPGIASLSQHEAVLDALGSLGVPIIADVECGHVPPYLPLVNGAHGRVVLTSDHTEIIQTLS
jgi:muramoyltetrapeptide carboxypeptidase